MTSPALTPQVLSSERPSRLVGVLVAAGSVAAVTGLIYPLEQVTPVLSLGVLYVPAVLVVSMFWGRAIGIGTSVLAAAAFNFFHLPPVGRFTIADSRNWVALGAFFAGTIHELWYVIVAGSYGIGALVARRGELLDLGFRVPDSLATGSDGLCALSGLPGVSWRLDQLSQTLFVTGGATMVP